jgi:inner membrane protein
MESNIISNFMTRNRVTFRAILVGFLILVLLIPAAFVNDLVHERQGRKLEVQEEVSSKWSGEQTVTGPIIAVPYLEHITDADDPKKSRILKHMAFFLPEQLGIKATLDPQTRHRSIFEVTVYDSKLDISGSFPPLNFEALHIPVTDLQLDQATVFFGLSDFRGIEEQVNMDWQGRALTFNAGLPADAPIPSGLQAQLPLTLPDISKPVSFRFSLKLRGSDRLYFTPVGKTTEVHMTSSWRNPSFDGEFLPVTKEVSAKGFAADWKVLHLNRNFPQSWKDRIVAGNTHAVPAPDEANAILGAAFGTRLFVTSDGYAMTARSAKYALLFIMLTFTLYFFIELFQKKRVHPLQYVLVGIALCVFYLLLLSISEYLGYDRAYIIATISTVGLVTLYTRSVFGQWKVAALFGGVLGFLYVFIFLLIQLEDGALLFGSIGLFAVLALVMWFSRKVDWYGKE